MATLDDIARQLRISKSTVSKALNGAEDVSEAMRRSVLETAVELGYSRAPRGTESPRIALFVTNMEYLSPEDFGYDIILGFRKLAEPAGFKVDIIPLTREMQRTMRYDEYMILGHYQGSFFLGMSLSDPWLKEFETCNSPTVLYDNHITNNPRVTHVGVDNEEGIRLAVNYLHELGHRTIGYLSGDLQSYVYQKRLDAFSKALVDHGLTVSPSLMGDSLDLSTCLSVHLPRLLEQGCSAIVCSHDLYAQGIMTRCQELGYRVPEDISIIGFDDLPLCQHTTPPLTTIRQNRDELGRSAYCALSSQLSQVPLSTFLLHAELIRRDSCTELA
ncbi:MAG: LacI family DNA-binding transcriptional regulator [Lachnospiraceae bacterium]|nr:LacI family DNA-binding transcriptional regulator [Lachnospiraceae bacterium]